MKTGNKKAPWATGVDAKALYGSGFYSIVMAVAGALACLLGLLCGATPLHNGGKPKGPVLQNAKSEEVATPTVKRGFVTPNFWGRVRQHLPCTVSGEMAHSARMGARLRTCFEHLTHLMRFKTQPVVPLLPEGVKTMTASTQARNSAAPSSTKGEVALIQLHADAHNALNMAVYYLKQPQPNTTAARRKAVQALVALRSLSLILEA